MIINDKLSHLSEVQIKEVVYKYEETNMKIKYIIEVYKIDVSPSRFLKILPPIETEEICFYCGVSMYKERPRRKNSPYSTNNTVFCNNCGHKMYLEILQSCKCQNCIDYQKKINAEKQEKIISFYGVEQPKFSFYDLESKDQVNLIYILKNNTKNNIKEISPLNHHKENRENWIKILDRLLFVKAISISPKNKPIVFYEKDFPKLVYLDRAIYNVNISFKNNILEQIDSGFFRNSIDIKLKVEMLKEYIYFDAIDKFKRLLKERNLNLYISEEADKDFTDLIDKVSYTQVMNLCYRVAVWLSDKVITNKFNAIEASNLALICVSKFYLNDIKENRTTNHSSYAYVGKELKYFIEFVLGKKLNLLEEVASIEALINSEDKE